jgi:hypothetical protein
VQEIEVIVSTPVVPRKGERLNTERPTHFRGTRLYEDRPQRGGQWVFRVVHRCGCEGIECRWTRAEMERVKEEAAASLCPFVLSCPARTPEEKAAKRAAAEALAARLRADFGPREGVR